MNDNLFDKKDSSLQIELKETVAEGVYSNMSLLAHSRSEFVLDFVSIMPGVSKAQVKSRIIMAPEHAKRLLIALQENVRKYESVFGEIRIAGNDVFPDLRGGKVIKGDA